MKSFATQVIGWAAAAVCALYVAMTFDLVPEGLLSPLGAVDDIGALMLGISAEIAAKRAGKDVKEVSRQITQRTPCARSTVSTSTKAGHQLIRNRR